MSRSTRSKMASAQISTDELAYLDDYKDGDDISSSKPHSVSKTTPLYSDSPTGSTLAGSTIINHKFGYLYPIPQSLQSPQIQAFQNGLLTLPNRIFSNASEMSQWFDDFMAQASLINLNEYLCGQIEFNLHPACDSLYHI